MPVALEQFVKQLADSGVIAPGKLENFVPPKAQPKDAQELARQLVQSKHLTKFQAQEIYQGRSKSLILGNYTILDKIGAGGMGQVFKAQHRRMERTVAIKMLPAATMKDPAAAARFQREVIAAAKLSHPNIVAAFDADEANGVHFLVMEFAEGNDLSVLVKKNGPFPVAKAVNYILQAATGLEFAHAHGVVHRDIKPANLLLNSEGVVKVLDMGLARIDSGSDTGTQAELTGTGAVLGTVDYMAPEQALSTKHVDGRADIYSLGCSLCYLLTGKPVYDGETITAKLIAHQFSPIPSLQKIRSDVPTELEAVFQKMVSKKVEDRYRSMTEVVAGLQEYAAPLSAIGRMRVSGDSSSDNTNLSFLAEASAQTLRSKPSKQATQVSAGAKPSKIFDGWDRKKQLRVGGGIIGLLILAGAVIFSLRTKDGTLVVEINQPDATVEVLDAEGKIEISRPGETGTMTIRVDPGKHRLKVEKAGFQLFAKEFEIESAGKTAIRATLEPAKKIAVAATPRDADRSVARWWLAKKGEPRSHGYLLVDTAGEAKLIYSDRDLPNGPFRIKKLGMSTISDGDLAAIAGLSGLDELDVTDAAVGDAGIECLAGAVALRRLVLHRTNVTAAGITAMRKNLPDCKIEWETAANSVAAFSDPAFQEWLTEVAALPANSQVDEVVKKLQVLNPGFDRQRTHKIENGVVTGLDFVTDHVTDISPVRALVGLKDLRCWGSAKGRGKLSNLSPLHGMKLTKLNCGWSPPLTDLSPLKGVPLTSLMFGGDSVSDLSPLEGMPLEELRFEDNSESDLSPLQGMTLNEICLTPKKITKGLDAIRNMKSLTRIGIEAAQRLPPEDFWRKYDAGEFGKPTMLSKPTTDISGPAFRQWMKEVAALPAEEQLQAVMEKMRLLNPGFDGVIERQEITNNVVTRIDFRSDYVTDLSPIQALVGLKTLTCPGTLPGRGKLSDLSPLQGMQLKELSCYWTKVSDLAPIRQLPLTKLDIAFVSVSDFSPLNGMALTWLAIGNNKLADLSPLRGMPLTFLRFEVTKVSDLSPLTGMPLSVLCCDSTRVSDLSPLKGMKLTKLNLTPNNITKGIDVIRQMKSLTDIGTIWNQQWPAAEFWKKYDAGEFGKPATK